VEKAEVGGGKLEGGRLGARSEVKVENVKDKGMRFIASELSLSLGLNLNLHILLHHKLQPKN
jgi:hypothetical protein